MNLRKAILLGAIFAVALFGSFYFVQSSFASTEPVNAYLFYGDGCPHCGKMLSFLRQFEKDNPDKAHFYVYEMYSSRENVLLFEKVGRKLGKDGGVPFLVIGRSSVRGFYSDNTTGKTIEQIIDNCYINGCFDPILAIAAGNHGQPTDLFFDPIVNPLPKLFPSGDIKPEPAASKTAEPSSTGNATTRMEIPFLGEVDLQKFSLPVLTAVLAFLDGFNPCAMWVLLFLISLLLGMENKKKMWLLGLIFIITSGIVYFVFLAAWLNFFLFIGFLPWIRLIIGFVAIVSGLLHLRKFLDKRTGCDVISENRRSAVFGKLKEITQDRRLVFAIAGIVLLAFSVNLIELVCSAGLPAVYTNVLSLSRLPVWLYYSYLILYVVIFMIDDMFVFVIAMTTLHAVGISGKYSRLSSLIGGVLIFLIGVLLIFKPSWLMFG